MKATSREKYKNERYIERKNGDVAQKHYEEATERFISAYQSYEKTRAFLKRAEETGDLEGIDIFTFFHLQSRCDLMNAIHAMDQAKSSIRMHTRNETPHRSHP